MCIICVFLNVYKPGHSYHKGAQTEALIQPEDETDFPSTGKPTWQAEPPKNIRKGTKEY